MPASLKYAPRRIDAEHMLLEGYPSLSLISKTKTRMRIFMQMVGRVKSLM